MTKGQQWIGGSSRQTVQLEVPQVEIKRGISQGVVRRSVHKSSGRRLSGWIVRTIVLATILFALLDLSLLLSGLQH